MGQKELIEFCKTNDPNFNKDASFKVLEPMWSIPKGIGGLGITESEFKNGFYVQIDTKGRKGFEHLEERVFYFRNLNPSNATGNMYNSHWKKYFIPLNDMESWSREITKQIIEEPKTENFIEEFSKKLENAVEEFKKFEVEPLRVEEFPIVKTQGKTTYSKRNTFIVVGKSNYNDNVILQDLDGKEIAHSKESFSDLVDLMIEARKDLLK